MKRIILILLFIFLLMGVSAQNISFNYPEEVHVGEEFTVDVGLTNFLGNNYDIKFDTSENGGNLLRVLNDEQWKSNHYYVIGIISNNGKKDFSLKVNEYVGTIKIKIKVRLSGTNSIEIFGNYEIESLETSAEDELTPETEEPVEDEEEDKETIKEEKVKEELQVEKLPSRETEPIELQTINLNPKVIKTEDDNENLSKSNYAIYGLVFFCVLLVVLFILRKNKYNKNEFR